ncbi:MAG: hypothetical protein HOY78_12335 [Saccharothrix sp.]|nr:hypothetical protein [Saccharothrix sp.]
MDDRPGPPGRWSRVETARPVILVALLADGLQIATALTAALYDPTKWQEFFTFSSIAAALVVSLVVGATWPAISLGGRALGIVFVLANLAFVVFHVRPEGATTPAATQQTPVPTTAPQAAVQPTSAPPEAAPPTAKAEPPAATAAVPTTTNPAAATPAADTWTVSVATSREATVAPGTGVQLRFWPYPSANEVVGDLRFEDGYAWAPVGFGSDCTVPYATYVFSGIPAGRYVVSVHVPDVDGLTSNAEYSGPSLSLSLNQSAHRGRWIDLPSVQTSEVEGEAMIGITTKQRYDQYSGETGCTVRGERIAFDSIKVTRVAQ